MSEALSFVFFGLSITSSWGNGHASTYRGLVRELVRLGHRVHFFERDLPFHAQYRDLPAPPWGTTSLYGSLAELRYRHGAVVRSADLVVVGSFVPDGIEIGKWVNDTARGATAFYDLDTPVTLGGLETGRTEYLTPELVRRYDLYLTFTGGPTLRLLAERWGAARARPLYCSADPELYRPEPGPRRWDLGYLGTYGADRQRSLGELLLAPARRAPGRRFVVAGPQYPPGIEWPANVERIEHVSPDRHRAFYNGQRLTLNVTRAPMKRAGWSPSVRLFEAAACGTPILSDPWPGLEELFLPGQEILVAGTADEALRQLERPDEELASIGRRARRRVLAQHTAAHRAAALEAYTHEVRRRSAPVSPRGSSEW